MDRVLFRQAQWCCFRLQGSLGVSAQALPPSRTVVPGCALSSYVLDASSLPVAFYRQVKLD